MAVSDRADGYLEGVITHVGAIEHRGDYGSRNFRVEFGAPSFDGKLARMAIFTLDKGKLSDDTLLVDTSDVGKRVKVSWRFHCLAGVSKATGKPYEFVRLRAIAIQRLDATAPTANNAASGATEEIPF